MVIRTIEDCIHNPKDAPDEDGNTYGDEREVESLVVSRPPVCPSPHVRVKLLAVQRADEQ